MYTCGITPYDASHLGHAATYLTYDVLQRRLRDIGHETRCVRNVTDVDDSILPKARELGVHYLDLAAGELARFQRDMARLETIPAWSEPRATSAIPDIRGFIGMVLDTGHAYTAGGAVYFDVDKVPDFGFLSHLDRPEMLELSAERGGNVDDPHKRNPLDFVLWQPSAADEPSWDTLWGPGRPGWHIECSALCLRELGTTIDLHGGGSDLIYCTTSARPPSPVLLRANRSCVTGCTRQWFGWTARRCPSRSATWCSSPTSLSSGMLGQFVWRVSRTTIGTVGSGTTLSWVSLMIVCVGGWRPVLAAVLSMRFVRPSTRISTLRLRWLRSTLRWTQAWVCRRQRLCSAWWSTVLWRRRRSSSIGPLGSGGVESFGGPAIVPAPPV